mgnify:CR=1 FL=1
MSIATEITRINNAKLAIRNTLNIPNTDKLDTYGFYLDGINSPFSPPKIVAKDYSYKGDLYRLQDAKNNLKEGLKDNGVDVSDNALIDTYNSLISQCRVPGATLQWETIEGGLPVAGNSFDRKKLWTDGNNVYYSTDSTQLELVIDFQGRMHWGPRSWTATQGGSVSLDGNYIWTDNTDIYYTKGSTSFILNKDTMTWDRITFNQSVAGDNIWTDGTNIYFSNSNRQFIFDKETKQWSAMTWNGLTSLYGNYVWTDGTDIYYNTYPTVTFMLDKSTNTWSSVAISGGAAGNSIMTDGKNIYGGSTSFQKIFNKTTKTWSTFTPWGNINKLFTLNPNKQISCQCKCNTFGQDRCLRAIDVLMPQDNSSSTNRIIIHAIRQFS